MNEIIKASDLEHLLSKKYSWPAWIFLPQVRSTTGFASPIRTADGIAINTYPSRGFEVNAFEIKISRSDWLVELKNVEKADEIFKFCNKFWIVAANKDIVKVGELPPGWGLMYPRANGLGTAVQSLNHESIVNMGFVCALLRRATEGMISATTVKQELSEQYRRGQKSRDYEFEAATKRRDELYEVIKNFEEASGIKIEKWNGDHDATTVGML